MLEYAGLCDDTILSCGSHYKVIGEIDFDDIRECTELESQVLDYTMVWKEMRHVNINCNMASCNTI